MIVLGLTGSIGMGKSTTARMFADLGVPVWDADAAVHRLYAASGEGSKALAPLVPAAVTDSGIDRDALRAAVLADPDLLPRIEAIIHPLVGADRDDFLARMRRRGEELVLCDIPLLFETGADRWLDKVVVVSAPAEVQRERVLARPGMSASVLETILARQVPDGEKRARADFVVETGNGLRPAREQVGRIVATLREISDA